MSLSNLDDLGKLLQAEYHYTYKTNNGQLITISVGEEFILIKKSNADWWQVIKSDQKKPFYVPAAYMKELNRKVFPDHAFFKKAYSKLHKEKKQHSSDDTSMQADRQSPVLARQENYLHGSKENISDLSSKSKYSMLRASCDSLDRFIENENPYDEVPFESKVSKPFEYDTAKEHSSKTYQGPEYENLERIQSHIAESRLSASPATKKKESNTMDLSHDQQSASDSMPKNAVVYANIDVNTGIQPSTSFKQSASTAVDEQDDGWKLQLDDQSNNEYYPNKITGEMSVKSPRRSADSPTVFVVPTLAPKKVSAGKVVPPPPPDVSKKPVLQRSIELAEPLSPLERRKTSPARLDGNSDLPEILDEDQDKLIDSPPAEFTKSKSLLKPSRIEPLKDKSSDSGVERRISFKDRFFPDSDKKKNKHKKANSDSSSHSQTKSPLSSPSTSPKVSKSSIDHSFSAEWIRERSQDGNIVFIRKSSGERWLQVLDNNSGNFYYFNETNHETSWLLPELESRDDDSSFPVDTEKSEVAEDDLALIEKSNHSQDRVYRKASTIERDTMPPTSKEEFMFHSASLPFDSNVSPKVRVKPKKDFKGQANRVKSMIVFSNRLSYEDSQQFDKSRLQHESDHSSPLPHPLIERKGRLNWTKLMEAGKKQRKNWVQQWLVLIANNLLFYKDEKQATMSKSLPHGKPDSSCDLRGATVDWANEKSSKKNVIELQTTRGLTLLLQHEDHSTIQKWLNTIKATIERANQVDGDDLVFKPPLFIEEEDESDTKKKKDKKKKKPMRHASDAKNSDSVRARLRKFISRRPTLESLQERGIIKEKLCQKEGTTVPLFVKLCVEEVERRGLDVDGIYRVSGNLSHVQKLRYCIDRDEPVDLSQVQWDDIHLITGALKMFLRELPEPVIPFAFFRQFITACKIQSNHERVNAMRALVSVLPRENRDTLRYLMEHFRKVVSHSSKNRMHFQNIAIVFGPTLLLKPPDNSSHELPGGSHMTVDMVYQNQIIDEMLTQYEHIFG